MKQHSFYFAPADQFRYYECRHCFARWKRAKKSNEPWILLASGAANAAEVKRLLTRQASLMEVAHDTEVDEGDETILVTVDVYNDPFSSWIGAVTVALPGEEWPYYENEPMLPLCQLRCGDIPTPSAALEPLAYLCVFGSLTENEDDLEDTKRWVVRMYNRSDSDKLIILGYPGDTSQTKPYTFKWKAVNEGPGGLPGVPEALWLDYMKMSDEMTMSDEIEWSKTNAMSKVSGYPNVEAEEQTPPEFLFQLHLRKDAPWRFGPEGIICFFLHRSQFTNGSKQANEWMIKWRSLGGPCFVRKR